MRRQKNKAHNRDCVPFYFLTGNPARRLETVGGLPTGGEEWAYHTAVWYAVLMRVRQLNHSVYQTEYHLVWGTLYRRKFLKQYVRDELIKGLYKVQKEHPDWYFIRINTGDDHVHLLMEIPPKYAISHVVQVLKSKTSFHLRKKFKFVAKIYDGKAGIWGTGYFVSTVGLNEANIKKYIDRQNNFDRGVDLTGELS